ncbi:MAG: S-ribosylhomocysteine lyase [Ruminococcaceae bacterium]|nr:S-ribosylhomocysteine lyase [Oscillospiraceae bacterium]
MEKIQSFTIDHTKIVPGMYISRVDGDITTYDLRFCHPNREELDGAAMHTIEHLFATFIRNTSLDVLYFGPMGCLTGFYLLIRNADHTRVQKEIQMVLKNIIAFEGEIYGASEVECGNYRFHNLEGAKKAAEAFGRVMENPAALVYPI